MKKIFCQQTHSNNVYYIGRNEKKIVISDCDGLFTDIPNIKLHIKTADCLPITITSKKFVGVVHAGWRGLENGIIKHAINKITTKFSVLPEEIFVKIGPAIDKDNYLVKSDVYNLFFKKYINFFKKISEDQWKMDLKGIASCQLKTLGIPNENITVSRISTFKNKKYPSYRRDGKSGGFVTSVMLK